MEICAKGNERTGAIVLAATTVRVSHRRVARLYASARIGRSVRSRTGLETYYISSRNPRKRKKSNDVRDFTGVAAVSAEKRRE